MVTPSGDPERSHFYPQGLEYLHRMQTLALNPALIGGLGQPHEAAIATWIGRHSVAWNRHLQTLVHHCHECFHPHARPQVQTFAVPLAPAFGLDGLCNHQTQPITILLDLGRVVPHHWLRLLVHEYAHAQVGRPGHDDAFGHSLAQLCLGLGLDAPPLDATRWTHWPPCQATTDALAFWMGRSEPFVTDH
jgi:hypothetical protein